jgi:hypothetical protein
MKYQVHVAARARRSAQPLRDQTKTCCPASIEASYSLVGSNENLEKFMKWNLGFAAFVLIALTFSIQTVAKDGKSQAELDFEQDPKNMAMDSARWSFIIDKSNSGLDLLQQPTTNDPDDHAKWLLGTDMGMKDVAVKLLQLRIRLLSLGLVKPSDGHSKRWPAWIFEPPTKHSPDVLSARFDWLQEEADELTGIGCKIGREKSNDELFCSVE